MKKIVCGFVFGLMLMVAGAQAWADADLQHRFGFWRYLRDVQDRASAL
jgi:hypothetical protein